MALERTNPPVPVTSVFLLAENRLLREALLRLLTKKEDIRIVGSAAYSPKILQEILLAAPEVVVLDSVSKSLWQDGVMRRLQDSKPQVKVLMIGMEADEALFLRMVAEGVLGYVLTDASASEVWHAIRCVSRGEAICPPSLSRALFRFVATAQNTFAGVRLHKSQDFSPRQLQLAQLIRQGLSNKELAAQLNLSEQTVKNHVHRMLRKVGAPDRATMAELAVRSNLN